MNHCIDDTNTRPDRKSLKIKIGDNQLTITITFVQLFSIVKNIM